MPAGTRYALDTNVLLRLSLSQDPLHSVIQTALRNLKADGVELCYTTQSLGEFWNVSTRPLARNGFDLPIAVVERHVRAIEESMTLLFEVPFVYQVWRRLLVEHAVRGVQVHDAHIAATLEVHDVKHLLTFNGSDFGRYDKLQAINPADVS
jgi:predicted nucleic acid-binding protein